MNDENERPVASAGSVADIIDRLCEGNVIVQMDATLTDAERKAIAYFSVIDGPQYLPQATATAATLRGLLERTK